MSLTAGHLDALLAAGATAEQIVALVKADITEQETAAEERRAKDRERQRRHRESRDVTQCHSDMRAPPSPDKSPPQTPQKTNPNPSPPYSPPTPQRIVEAWNDMAGRTGLPAVKTLTPDRSKRLKARLSEHGEDGVKAAILAVAKSPFCRGENDQGWRADFDFVLQAKSCARLIEGSYGRHRNERLTV